MKIITAAYPRESNWRAWVAFDGGDMDSHISLVFLERLTYLANNVLKRKIYIKSGFRTHAEQQAAYDAWKAGIGNPAQPAEYSWHEFYDAVDFRGPGTLWPELQSDYKMLPVGQNLRKYGLAIPNWIGSSTGVHEWWHIQPYETIGYAGDRSGYLDVDDIINGGRIMQRGEKSPNVQVWQESLLFLGIEMRNDAGQVYTVADTNFGGATENATKTFQGLCGLPKTGVVDEKTWAAMVHRLMSDSSAVTQLKAQVEALKGTVASGLARENSIIATVRASVAASEALKKV